VDYIKANILYNTDMQRSQIIIVSFLKQIEKGTEFIPWPNHITLVPFFWTDNLEKLTSEVRKICIDFKPIEYYIGEIEYLGRRKNVKASKVISNEIIRLQKRFHELASKHDKKFNSNFLKGGFLPHITHNETPYPTEGQRGEIKEIYLVLHLYSNKKDKKVLEIIRLG
jgi:hypothetical protein